MKTRGIIFITSVLVYSYVFPNVFVLNGLTHFYSGKSGDVISGQVVLKNVSTETQYVTFELSDAIFSETEGRMLSSGNGHSQSSKAWFNGSLMTKTLHPEERYVYQFTIQIPSNGQLKGIYWSMLLINVKDRYKWGNLEDTVDSPPTTSHNITLITHLENDDLLNLDFKSIGIRNNSVTLESELEVLLYNHGPTMEAVRLSVEVYDREGNIIFERSTERLQTMPGLSKDFKIDFSQLPDGDYECVLLADIGGDGFIATRFDLRRIVASNPYIDPYRLW